MKQDLPTKESIIAAVKNSGYLLEQEIASRLESLKFTVESNSAYEDQDSGKSREIDIRAFRTIQQRDVGLSAFTEFLCECKNKSAPLIFFARKKNQDH